MKTFTLIIFLVIFVTLLFVTFSNSPLTITWLDWNIQIDAFIVVLFWLLSLVVVWFIISLFKVPKRLKSTLQKYNTRKSNQTFNQAILHFLDDEFVESYQAFNSIKEGEDSFLPKLMSAVSCIRSNNLNNAILIIRALSNDYPQHAPILQCLLAKWLLQLEEYHLAYETLASEIKGQSPLPQKWFLILEVCGHTGRLSEWKTLLPLSKEDLSRQQFKELHLKLCELQIKYVENSRQLNQVWESISTSLRSHVLLQKIYLHQCSTFNVEINYLANIKSILKHHWDSDWLWQAVNYKKFTDFHELLDWCKKQMSTNNYPITNTYLLSLAVISCRAQLWAISEDFLVQAEKSLALSEQHQAVIILVRGWIDSQLEQNTVTKQWIKLMKQHKMFWVE